MKKIIFILALSFSFISCSKQDDSKQDSSKLEASKASAISASAVPNSQSDFDFATVVLGGKLYKKNCASCHGENAEGSANWRKRKPDGKLLPPPLNGSGHTWHHAKSLLVSIITKGTVIQGGEMPAWENKLSQQEIEAVILWAQSKWPEETYKNWLEINNR